MVEKDLEGTQKLFKMELKYIIFSLLFAVFQVNADGYSDKLLLVSMDGFRYDYLTRTKSPNLKALAKEGVQTEVNVTYIALTFPCHFTMATGLWQEEHGITGNELYDTEFDQYFDMHTRLGTEDGKWWSGGEPIWITVRQQNKKSATLFWPGSEAEIKGTRPNFYLKYDKNMPFNERIDKMIEWFTKENVNFGALYFNEPDVIGHKHGPNSKEVLDKVEELDGNIGYLVDRLKKENLFDKINLIVTSDHGMGETDPSKFIDLSKCVNQDDVDKFGNHGPSNCNILPKKGKEEAIFNGLKKCHDKVQVFYKKDIPDSWHYKKHRRILPIVAVAADGYQFIWDEKMKWDAHGQHGWDTSLQSMHPFFIARGPNFKQGFQPKQLLQQVDYYPMICELLNLKPAPNNGSLDATKDFLRKS